MQLITGPEPSTGSVPKPQRSDGRLSPEVAAIYPMTTAQEGLWLAYNNAPHHTLYNLTLKFTFSPDANKDYDCSLEALHNGQYRCTHLPKLLSKMK